MTDSNPFLPEGSEPEDTDFIFIVLPGAIEPDERESRFGAPLDADLRVAGIGFVSGGGSLFSAPDENDECQILFAGVDVNVLDIGIAREVLRDWLPDLGCPIGTRIQFGEFQDRFDGSHWRLDEPRDEEF